MATVPNASDIARGDTPRSEETPGDEPVMVWRSAIEDMNLDFASTGFLVWLSTRPGGYDITAHIQRREFRVLEGAGYLHQSAGGRWELYHRARGRCGNPTCLSCDGGQDARR